MTDCEKGGGEEGWGGGDNPEDLKNNGVVFACTLLQQAAQGSLCFESGQLCGLKEHLCIFKIKMPLNSSSFSKLVKENTHPRDSRFKCFFGVPCFLKSSISS